MLQGTLEWLKSWGAGEHTQATSFFPGLHLLLFLGQGYQLSGVPTPLEINDNSGVEAWSCKKI